MTRFDVCATAVMALSAMTILIACGSEDDDATSISGATTSTSVPSSTVSPSTTPPSGSSIDPTEPSRVEPPCGGDTIVLTAPTVRVRPPGHGFVEIEGCWTVPSQTLIEVDAGASANLDWPSQGSCTIRAEAGRAEAARYESRPSASLLFSSNGPAECTLADGTSVSIEICGGNLTSDGGASFSSSCEQDADRVEVTSGEVEITDRSGATQRVESGRQVVLPRLDATCGVGCNDQKIELAPQGGDETSTTRPRVFDQDTPTCGAGCNDEALEVAPDGRDEPSPSTSSVESGRVESTTESAGTDDRALLPDD